MEIQAAFVLVAFLYLASPLPTAQAVRYTGPANVSEGQPWSIVCTGHKPGEKFNWTRNGLQLDVFTSSDLSVMTKLDKGTSELIAEHATDLHEGFYRCVPSGNESFHLVIKSETTIKVFTGTKLTLTCETDKDEKNVIWKKEEKNADETFEKSVVETFANNRTLVIHKKTENVFGNYTCKASSSENVTSRYRVVRKPMAVLAKSVNVVEGEKLRLICGGKDTEAGAKMKWTCNENQVNTSDKRFKLLRDEERGINDAVLVIENVRMSDQGNVSCYVSYDENDHDPEHFASATTLLRVKDKLAALWPFLGICLEVVILCSIILIYEKKRNKAELEESDTDQSPDTKPTSNKDSEVRQRK